jgi:uncharacterized protein
VEWEGREESQNVEDRRGIGGMVGIGGGVIGVIVVVVGLLLGVDPRQLINMGGGDQAVQQGTADPAEERQAHFAMVIFHDTEVVWTDLFKKMGKTYEKPTLVLFSGRVN